MTDAPISAPRGARQRLAAWAGDLSPHATDLVLLAAVILSSWVIFGELFGRGRGNEGSWHLITGHLIQPIGWVATVLVMGATLYYSTKRSVLFGLSVAESDTKSGVARRLRRALDQHIAVSVIAVGLAGLHVLNFLGAIRLTTGWLSIGLMLVVTGSGTYGRFVATAPALRKHWRRFHLPVTVLFFVVLTVHILVKIGLTGAGGD